MTKKKQTPKSDTLYVHVLYSQDETGGVRGRGGHRTDKYITTSFKGAMVSPEEHLDYETRGYNHSVTFPVPKEVFDVPRSQVYAVVGYYRDGDTFGTCYGNMHVVAVYGNSAKAFAVARILEKESRAETESIFGSEFHVPWGGYFARLERVSVEPLNITQFELIDDNVDPNDIPSW